MIKRGQQLVLGFLDGLLGEDSTLSLERFIAAATLGSGIWVTFRLALSVVDMPGLQAAMGAMLLGIGGFRAWVLWPKPPRTWLCRVAALSSSSLWAAIAAMLVVSVPRSPYGPPLTIALAVADLLLWARLKLLYGHEKRSA